MTPVDRDRFVAAYRTAAGREYGEAPVTVEALFDRLHDADEFSADTRATLHATLAAAERRSTVLTDDPRVGRVTVYPGDVRVTSNFTFDSHVLVLGDLDVEGVVTAQPAHAILMVAGSIRCRAMQLVRGYLFVTGDVVARDVFLGTAYGFSKVAGSIKTSLYLEDDSWSNVPLDAAVGDESTHANVESGLILDIDLEGARSRLAHHLVDGALGEEKDGFGEGHADVYALLDKLARGERILRA